MFACVTAAVACRAIRRYGLWESGLAVLISSGGVLFCVCRLGYFCLFDPCFSPFFSFFDLAFFLILVGRMQEARKHL